ncbi:uncharacterized protein METZ01_LOCUS270863 [marine metagenome]|uniref:Uncharacterized protein n=1 Tax=marine metagenome TaxID=408172 RepID=A0A382K1N6_9ZZZZ
MEWHQYFRSIRECWIVLIYDTGREVQADQEDGTAEVDLPISIKPHISGVFCLWDDE